MTDIEIMQEEAENASPAQTNLPSWASLFGKKSNSSGKMPNANSKVSKKTLKIVGICLAVYFALMIVSVILSSI